MGSPGENILLFLISAPISRMKELFYTCHGPPRKWNFIGKFLLVELVTIIVGYFARNVIKVLL